MTAVTARPIQRPASAPDNWICGRAGTRTYSCELIFDNDRVDVRKLKRTLRKRRQDVADEPWPEKVSRKDIDHRLACLYQATLEAPIPQDMLRLVEKIGARQDHKT
jgi:hypothetical protein